MPFFPDAQECRFSYDRLHSFFAVKRCAHRQNSHQTSWCGFARRPLEVRSIFAKGIRSSFRLHRRFSTGDTNAHTHLHETATLFSTLVRAAFVGCGGNPARPCTQRRRPDIPLGPRALASMYFRPALLEAWRRKSPVSARAHLSARTGRRR